MLTIAVGVRCASSAASTASVPPPTTTDDVAGDALGGGVVGDRGAVPAARDDVHGAAGDDHVGLRGDAVVARRRPSSVPPVDVDVAERRVLVVVGLQRRRRRP